MRIGLLALVLAATPSFAERAWPNVAAPLPPAGGGERDAAVVVGIGDYFALPDISGAAELATAWYTWLTKVRGVPAGRVRLLRNGDATREDIAQAAADAAAKADAGGLVWFVFIGHGAPNARGDDGLLLGVDAQPAERSLLSRGLAQRDVLTALTATRATPIAIFDACFSGQAPDGKTPLVPGSQATLPVRRGQSAKGGAIVLSSSEHVAGPLPGHDRPAFSYLLLGALRGWGDADGSGEVTLGEAFDHTKEVLTVAVHDRDQVPALRGGTRDLVLARAARERAPDVAAVLAGSSGSAGTTLALRGDGPADGRLRAIDSVLALTDPAMLASFLRTYPAGDDVARTAALGLQASLAPELVANPGGVSIDEPEAVGPPFARLPPVVRTAVRVAESPTVELDQKLEHLDKAWKTLEESGPLPGDAQWWLLTTRHELLRQRAREKRTKYDPAPIANVFMNDAVQSGDPAYQILQLTHYARLMLDGGDVNNGERGLTIVVKLAGDGPSVGVAGAYANARLGLLEFETGRSAAAVGRFAKCRKQRAAKDMHAICTYLLPFAALRAGQPTQATVPLIDIVNGAKGVVSWYPSLVAQGALASAALDAKSGRFDFVRAVDDVTQRLKRPAARRLFLLEAAALIERTGEHEQTAMVLEALAAVSSLEEDLPAVVRRAAEAYAQAGRQERVSALVTTLKALAAPRSPWMKRHGNSAAGSDLAALALVPDSELHKMIGEQPTGRAAAVVPTLVHICAASTKTRELTVDVRMGTGAPEVSGGAEPTRACIEALARGVRAVAPANVHVVVREGELRP